MKEQTLNNKIVMCGNVSVGQYYIPHIIKSGIKIDYFVCLTPEQGKKYNISNYFDYRPMAQEFKIPYYTPQSFDLKAQQDIDFFEQHNFDLLIQGGWQRLFPENILNTLNIGAIGVHGSSDFLPKGRGRSPLNWSLIEGKKRFIIHYFLIQAGIDDGDIFTYKDFDINEFDDIETLYYKNALTTRDVLIEYIPKLLNNDYNVTPQVGKASYYPKRTPEDGQIDWEKMDVYEIYNFIRAQTKPYPGAFGNINNTIYKIWKARIFDTRIAYPDKKYGDIIEMFDQKILVNCRGGLLLIDEYEQQTS